MGDVGTQVRKVTRRIRVRRGAEAFARLSIVGLALVLVAVLFWKLERVSSGALRAWAGFALLLPIAGAAFAASRRVPKELAAKLVDLRFALHDRTVSAVEFGDVPEAERTAFMDAAVRDAEERVREVRPADAVPFRAPRDVLPALGLATAILGLTFVAFPRPHPQEVESTLVPFEVHEEELEAYREYARDLLLRAEGNQAGPLHDAAEALNRLVEDLADRRVDREEAFRRLGELEDRFLRGQEATPEELERALRAMGDELRHSELTKEVGQKLQDADLNAAREEVQKLAQALRDERPESQKALERAREALQRAAEEAPEDVRERLEELRREMQEQQESLLKKKQEKNGDAEAEERLLKRRQRELERLERQQQMSENLRRQLDRLQREMDRTAETLNQSPQEAAEAMERMAEELNRLAQDQEAQEELARMLERMQDMREMLRRQQRGQGRDQQNKRAGQLGKFYQLARGRQGMRIAGPGQQGEQGQDGQQGQGGEQAKVLQLGEGNDQLLIPLPGMGQGMRGQGQQPGGLQQGQGIGSEHDPRMGAATNLDGRRETVQVQGTQNEDGASRSQVIMGAADQGFASQGYHRVYGEYRRVMEEDLDLQDIPPGVRGHLRDYMDLIRPQE